MTFSTHFILGLLRDKEALTLGETQKGDDISHHFTTSPSRDREALTLDLGEIKI